MKKKILAERPGDAYLVEAGEGLGQIYDLRTKRLWAAKPVQALLKWGYWQPGAGTADLSDAQVMPTRTPPAKPLKMALEVSDAWRDAWRHEVRLPKGVPGGGEWISTGVHANPEEKNPWKDTHRDPVAEEIWPGNGERLPDQSHEAAVQRLLAVHELAKQTPSYQEDLHWYNQAHEEIANRAAKLGVAPEIYTAVVAATAPKMEWEDRGNKIGNLTAADRVIKAALDHPEMSGDEIASIAKGQPDYVGIMHGPIRNGVKALRSGDPVKGLNGPKVRSFYNNIVFPDDPSSVTVDAHMAHAIVGTHLKDAADAVDNVRNGYGKPKKAGYGWSADVLREAARRAGVPAQQFQAATWTYWRTVGGSRLGGSHPNAPSSPPAS